MLFKDITKNDLRRLVNVVYKMQEKTRLTGIFLQLHSDARIGNKRHDSKGYYLELMPRHIEEISNHFYKETDYRLSDGHPNTRIEASILKICSEKVSKYSPKERVVEMRSFNGEVKINGDVFKLPNNSALAIDDYKIISIEHDCVFIIENYEAFINTDLSLLSPEVENALIIYRGDKETGIVKKFIDALKVPVYGWFDSDPQGINIALATKGITAFYLPENNHKLYEKFGLYKPYKEQKKFIENLKIKLSHCEYVQQTLKIYEYVEGCLMQESMLRQKTSLSLITVAHAKIEVFI